ncbi:MAG: FKBP-type peptidyl-prolyl cis-trans isomerase [Spirochaetia bacterium]|nr:FKBP-type peptidyl-prolyl cis-trans isomerase [Spirochaetia bacterium]MCF7941078.1 FKBP-type peptidyl-prolyl cis-trans isomerase [Spirochaetia bacterium]
MKHGIKIVSVIMVLLVIGAAGCFAGGSSEKAEAPSELKAPETLLERFSYAFGYMFTESYVDQGIDFAPEYFAQAMADALEGTESLYSEEELEAILTEYQMELIAKQEAAQAEAGAANQKEADDFLATNKTRAGVTETASGLQYEVEVAGDGEIPQADDVVTVHYTGSFLNGQVFESSKESGNPATFMLSAVIPGWVEGVQLMPVGSTYRFFIPPALAYGEAGSQPVIEPNQLLIFEIELLSIDTDKMEE